MVAALVAKQRFLKVWHKLVNRFCAVSDFARNKYIEGGFPAEKIEVKPNFVSSDAEAGTGRGGYAVFVARLSPEKGIATLLEAWSKIEAPIQLRILGDGPLLGQLQEAAASDPRIECLGHRPLEEVCRIVGEAACLIMPSLSYETFGRTIIEAYAAGTPPIVSRLGAMAELVDDGRTGLLFHPGDPDDLAEKVMQLMKDPKELARMREAARNEFEEKYTPAVNYRLLQAIYERTVASVAR